MSKKFVDMYATYYSLMGMNEYEMALELKIYFDREIMVKYNETKDEEIASATTEEAKNALRRMKLRPMNARVACEHFRSHPLDIATKTLKRARQYDEYIEWLRDELHTREEDDVEARNPRMDLNYMNMLLKVLSSEGTFLTRRITNPFFNMAESEKLIRPGLTSANITNVMSGGRKQIGLDVFDQSFR